MNKLAFGVFSAGLLFAMTAAVRAQEHGAARVQETTSASATTRTRGERHSTFAETKGRGERNAVPQDAVDRGKTRTAAELMTDGAVRTRKLGGQPRLGQVKDATREGADERPSAGGSSTAISGTGKSNTFPTPGETSPTDGADQGNAGLGPYVRALVAQGLRGQELAAAIHAEQALRHRGNGHGPGHKAGGAQGKGGTIDPTGTIGNKGPVTTKPPVSVQPKPIEATRASNGGSHRPGRPDQGEGTHRGKGGKGKGRGNARE